MEKESVANPSANENLGNRLYFSKFKELSNKKLWFLAGIILLILFTRFILIDLRPIHSDEGVNYFFAKNIIMGNNYHYDPNNYHGPFYFYTLAFSFVVLGINVFSLRFPAILSGIFLLIFLLLFKFKDKEFENKGKFIALIFLIFSPSIYFYSRYSIHETMFLLCSFLSIYFLSSIFEEKNLKKLKYFAISLALAFTLKETVIILFPIFLLTIILNIKNIKEINFKKEYKSIILSIIIFIIIYSIFFTSFFTNFNGIGDSFKSLVKWTNRGVSEKGHDKPFYYFFVIILKYELLIFVSSLIGIYYSIKKKSIFLRNLSIWFVAMFIIYSLIPYKTPWLIINITFPMYLLSGYGISEAISRSKENIKKYWKLFIVISLLSILYFFISLNFIYPYQKQNSFAYVHTDIDINDLVKELAKESNSTILVLSQDYWPLPFYIDNSFNNRAEYLNSKLINLSIKHLNENDIIITDNSAIKNSEIKNLNYTTFKLRSGVYLNLINKKNNLKILESYKNNTNSSLIVSLNNKK